MAYFFLIFLQKIQIIVRIALTFQSKSKRRKVCHMTQYYYVPQILNSKILLPRSYPEYIKSYTDIFK